MKPTLETNWFPAEQLVLLNRNPRVSPTDEYVNLFAGIECSLDRVARAFRSAVPKGDKHVACIDETLVSGRRLLGIRELIERGWDDLD